MSDYLTQCVRTSEEPPSYIDEKITGQDRSYLEEDKKENQNNNTVNNSVNNTVNNSSNNNEMTNEYLNTQINSLEPAI